MRRRVVVSLIAAASVLAVTWAAFTLRPGVPAVSPANRAPRAGGATSTVPIIGRRWVPKPATPWQWELDHPLDIASSIDMGRQVADYLGHPAPDPSMYDIDGFATPASTVAALHGKGDHVVCYMEIGALERYRPDASSFPASVLGNAVSDYPSERYLDIRRLTTLEPLITARLQVCRSKGFDAVEPDIDDAYAEGASVTGFPLTIGDQIRYDTMIAADAHRLGMSIALKNGADPPFVQAMVPITDFAIDEECFASGGCAALAAFVDSGKAVFEAEYRLDLQAFCPAAVRMRFNAVRYPVLLDGGRSPCR